MPWSNPRGWTDHLIVTRKILVTEVRDNLRAINSLLGHPNGGLRSLTDGGILLGNGTGTIDAMAVLAKGALVVGDGAADPGTLAVGTDGYLLVADSAETLGVKWQPDGFDVAEAQMFGIAEGG